MRNAEIEVRRHLTSDIRHPVSNARLSTLDSQPRITDYGPLGTIRGRIYLGVLVSGSGTNLQAILDASAAGGFPAEVSVVVSDRPGAYALERARRAEVPAYVVPRDTFPDRASFEREIIQVLERHGVEIVCLAGFLRILSASFVDRFPGRILNIHPALLPAFGGKGMYGERVHRAVLASGATESGCTVHFVTADVDAGPVVLQATVPVLPDDTPASLAQRVAAQEHRIYPEAIRMVAEGLRVAGRIGYRISDIGPSTLDSRLGIGDSALKRRALISVTNKTGLVGLARELAEMGFEVVSTGGTADALRQAGLPVTAVSEVTGFPEILGGRVKTLHPAIHAAILARPTDSHLEQLAACGIDTIDLVVVNLYDFEGAAASDASWEELIEQVDVGGPAMIRAAAKNCERVTVVTDPSQYDTVLAEIRAHGEVSQQTRHRLAVDAFRCAAHYDATIARTLADRLGPGPLSSILVASWTKVADLRYGENPHQEAAFYREPLGGTGTLASAMHLGGKALSYNNILDADAALGLVREFAEPAAVIVKHTNPCGCAVARSLSEAVGGALRGDPVSAFGGVVACNRPVDVASADAMLEVFLEVVVGPAFDPDALDKLRARRNLRLLAVGPLHPPRGAEIRSVVGGVLVQESDSQLLDETHLRVVTSREPTPEEWDDMRFAWAVCKHTKSNAIVLARGGEVVGVGAGQMSRVDSVRLAVTKAGERARGAVLASDAFFPFPDGVEEAARAGVVAIIQPGGSVRDDEVVAAAERAGCAMVLTGVRHFRH